MAQGKESENIKKSAIIIRKKKAAHHDAHHGGAWKVAYADFVTAMMAFFLLMWLLNATTEEQKKGISEYFNPVSISKSSAGAQGVLDGGQAAHQKDGMVESPGDKGVPIPLGVRPMTHSELQQADAKDEASFKQIEEGVMKALQASAELKDLAGNLKFELTPDGLRIQIFDRDGYPMFPSGSAEPHERLKYILSVLSRALTRVQNGIVLTGHTDSAGYTRNGYTNWELSSDRANAARRYLVGSGTRADRFFRVEGRADTDPLIVASPLDPRNRRTAITVLRTGHPDTLGRAANETDRDKATRGEMLKTGTAEPSQWPSMTNHN